MTCLRLLAQLGQGAQRLGRVGTGGCSQDQPCPGEPGTGTAAAGQGGWAPGTGCPAPAGWLWTLVPWRLAAPALMRCWEVAAGFLLALGASTGTSRG